MSVTVNSLSEDARIVLRLISRSARPRLTYTATNILAMHPNHLAAHRAGETAAAGAGPETAHGCVAMDLEEVTRALDELSQDGGWLASFTPGTYMFRALSRDMPADPCNPDHAARGLGRTVG